MNALQLEHADLSRRAAWRGKTTDLAAGRQDPVAGDDQRHRILGHGFTDVARGLILVEGAVPGAKGGWITVRDAVKKNLPKEAPQPGAFRLAASEGQPAASAAPAAPPGEGA